MPLALVTILAAGIVARQGNHEPDDLEEHTGSGDPPTQRPDSRFCSYLRAA